MEGELVMEQIGCSKSPTCLGQRIAVSRMTAVASSASTIIIDLVYMGNHNVRVRT